MAEKILYNIKMVSSFANFEFEQDRFNKLIEICHEIDKTTIKKLGIFIEFLMFFMNSCMFIAILYGKILIDNDYNGNKGRSFKQEMF